ncbi:glyoxalase-like domain-containing protein [Whalleya microplaca]|nr:glyoxalase-like domain-containing protein [Whalleya microplaca]
MASSSFIPILDHVVVLVPHSFITSPPSWITDLFTLYPGGQHSDGRTENTLVLFADGSYLEFIAFVPGIDPHKRESHKWGRKQEGTIVDWAVSLALREDAKSASATATEDRWAEQEKAFHAIQQKVRDAGAGIQYSDLAPGGRNRLDGEELKWAISTAEKADIGVLPFWCLDVTPRHLRVPYTEPGITDHPSGTTGVARVSFVVETPGDDVDKVRSVYDALLGKEELESKHSSSWNVETLNGKGLHPASQVSISVLDDEDSPGLGIELFAKEESPSDHKAVGGKIDGEHFLNFVLVKTSGN